MCLLELRLGITTCTFSNISTYGTAHIQVYNRTCMLAWVLVNLQENPWFIGEYMSLNESRMLVKDFPHTKGTRVLVKRFTARQGHLSRDTQISACKQPIAHVSVNLCVMLRNTVA